MTAGKDCKCPARTVARLSWLSYRVRINASGDLRLTERATPRAWR